MPNANTESIYHRLESKTRTPSELKEVSSIIYIRWTNYVFRAQLL